MTFYFTPVFKYIFLYVLICLLLIAGCWTNMVGCWLRRRGEEEQDGGRDRAGRGTTGGAAGRPCPAAGGATGRRRPAPGQRRSSVDRLRFWHLRFEERLPTRSHESPSASHTSGQATADSARWGEACNFMFFILVHIMCSKS
jgi:hypothetical protein